MRLIENNFLNFHIEMYSTVFYNVKFYQAYAAIKIIWQGITWNGTMAECGKGSGLTKHWGWLSYYFSMSRIYPCILPPNLCSPKVPVPLGITLSACPVQKNWLIIY